MKKRLNENNMQITKRLTAILVAVVFVFGMMYIPAEVFAAEPDTAGDTIEATEPATETVDTEAIDNEEDVTEEETTEVADAESPADETTVDELTDLVVVKDGNGNDVDLEDIDEDAFDGFIYKIKDDVTKTEIMEMEEAIDDLEDDQTAEEITSNELYAADSIETISEVAQPEQIEYIEPNYIVEAMGTNDPYYDSYGWFLELTNAPYVWEKGIFGEGVTIAVLDSGVKMDHPDFENTDFTGQYNTRATKDTDLYDVADNSGHGTGVTGIIAASYNNQKGSTGIMPETTIMPVKVLEVNSEGKTTGSMADAIKGLDYAVNNGADIVNMSFGDESDNNSLKEACQRAASKGVILVAPSGNDYDDTPQYPASYDTVVSVASIERDGEHSDFSNYNQYVSVAAPGRSIVSTWKDGGYRLVAGTSYSAPQVSALAAMVKQMDPSVNCADFMNILAVTSLDQGTKGFDPYFGYGLIDFKKAYDYMAGDIAMYEAYLSGTSFVYDGKVKTPSVTVKKAGKTLSSDYYKTTYASGRTKAGTYQVTIEGINGYTGKKVLSFSIYTLGDISKYAVSLSSQSYVYDGTAKTPSVTVKKAGKALSSKCYKVTYATGRKAVGTYKVTAAGRGGYIGTKTLYFKIVPPLVKGIKKPERLKGKLTVRWYAMSTSEKAKYKNAITGYQVRVAANAKFTGAKYAKVTGYTKTKVTVKGLKKKTYYYVQYRSYKTVGSKTYYSKWSGTKKAKTK